MPNPGSVGPALQAAYDEQYADSMTAWREIGGKYKVRNLIEVCRGRTFDKLLDCGAGEGSNLKFIDLSDLCNECYALEISDSGIAQISKRALQKLKEVRKFDGYTIPYPDGYFSVAYCSHVVEHVEHPRLLLRELKRVSRHQVFEIPLDYSIDVDRRVKHYLGYGHINIYTPALFRFLLKSEGFEILVDKLSHTTADVTRFNRYRNLGIRRTLFTDIKISLLPLRRALRRMVLGRERYNETGYSAYTCLTRAAGELQIFGQT